MNKIKEIIKKNALLYRILEPIYYCIAKTKEYLFFFFRKDGIFDCFIKFEIWGLLRVAYSKVNPKKYKELTALKNVHKGEKCFIIATGPSLTVEDIELIKESGHITFSMNTIYMLFDKTDWRPDYYCALDMEFLKDLKEKMSTDTIANFARNRVFCDLRLKKELQNEKISLLAYNRLLHGFGYIKDIFKFSDNIVKGIYDGYTITNVAIWLAYYMGFKEIVLVGVDCGYKKEQRHAYNMDVEGEKEKFSDKVFVDAFIQMKVAYEYIKGELEKRNVEVYNASRGGTLEAFPRVQLEEML